MCAFAQVIECLIGRYVQISLCVSLIGFSVLCVHVCSRSPVLTCCARARVFTLQERARVCLSERERSPSCLCKRARDRAASCAFHVPAVVIGPVKERAGRENVPHFAVCETSPPLPLFAGCRNSPPFAGCETSPPFPLFAGCRNSPPFAGCESSPRRGQRHRGAAQHGEARAGGGLDQIHGPPSFALPS